MSSASMVLCSRASGAAIRKWRHAHGRQVIVSMFKAIFGVASAPESEPHLEDFDAAQTFIAKLETKINDLEDLVLTQTDQGGAMEEKKQSREGLVTLAVQIVGAILSYAHNKGDKRLEKKAGISATALGKAKDSKVVALCRGIHRMAVPLAQALKPSKSTAEISSRFVPPDQGRI